MSSHDQTTWRELISAEMTSHADSMDGGTRGSPFTLWTDKRVYFPVCCDGAEWCGSVPRNPCDEATGHQGGG